MRRESPDVRREGAVQRTVRLDKWLWAARFFKSRALAVEAITGGKVAVNAERVKPSREVRAGDQIRLRLGPYEHVLTVTDVSERRGPASQAVLLYSETTESRAAREKLHWQLKHASPVIERGDARPNKKDRRDLRRLKGS
ncbi:MAG TPA: S4 domain-containing protein [Gemmatimonadaceae bacterium]|nr:S4 domain-containing protein [Gemmatimonadaceae bacterium]